VKEYRPNAFEKSLIEVVASLQSQLNEMIAVYNQSRPVNAPVVQKQLIPFALPICTGFFTDDDLIDGRSKRFTDAYNSADSDEERLALLTTLPYNRNQLVALKSYDYFNEYRSYLHGSHRRALAEEILNALNSLTVYELNAHRDIDRFSSSEGKLTRYRLRDGGEYLAFKGDDRHYHIFERLETVYRSSDLKLIGQVVWLPIDERWAFGGQLYTADEHREVSYQLALYLGMPDHPRNLNDQYRDTCRRLWVWFYNYVQAYPNFNCLQVEGCLRVVWSSDEGIFPYYLDDPKDVEQRSAIPRITAKSIELTDSDIDSSSHWRLRDRQIKLINRFLEVMIGEYGDVATLRQLASENAVKEAEKDLASLDALSTLSGLGQPQT